LKTQILSINHKKYVETTLPSLINSSVIDKVGIIPSSSIDNAIEREIQYRRNLQNIFLSILLFVLTATLLYVVPLYPVPIVFLIAIVISLIGFRSPFIGFSLSIFTFIPAYLYQTQVPFWWLLINLFLVGLFAIRSLTDKNNLLSPIIGLLSGALFLTPYYFLSIPLMLSVVLIRKEHNELFRNLGMCFMFLMILIPFGALSFSYSTNMFQLMFFMFFFGLGFGLSVPTRLAMIGDYFGRTNYGTILSLIMTVGSIFGVISPVAVGWGYDVLGNYRQPFLILALISSISIPGMYFIQPIDNKSK